jgi:hypothetical protein
MWSPCGDPISSLPFPVEAFFSFAGCMESLGHMSTSLSEPY